MPKETAAERSAQPRTPPPARMRRFEAPKEMPADLGVTSQSEDEIHGVVTTENVRTLLDAFGLEARTEIQFPFQHMKRQHGEIWRMRIEPAATHTVDGQTVAGHKWVYVQDMPERVGSVQ